MPARIHVLSGNAAATDRVLLCVETLATRPQRRWYRQSQSLHRKQFRADAEGATAANAKRSLTPIAASVSERPPGVHPALPTGAGLDPLGVQARDGAKEALRVGAPAPGVRLVPRRPQLAAKSSHLERHGTRDVFDPGLVRPSLLVRVKCTDGAWADICAAALHRRKIPPGFRGVHRALDAALRHSAGLNSVLREVQYSDTSDYEYGVQLRWRPSVGGPQRVHLRAHLPQKAVTAG